MKADNSSTALLQPTRLGYGTSTRRNPNPVYGKLRVPLPEKNAGVQKSGGKHMFMFFKDRKDLILQHPVSDG